MSNDRPVLRERRGWIVVSAGVASISSFVLSAFALRELDLGGFGTFSLTVAGAFLVAAMIRSSIAEVGYDRATAEGSLPRRRMAIGCAVALPLSFLLYIVQFAVASVDRELVLAAVAFAGSMAVAEIGKIRLVSAKRFGELLCAELVRFAALLALLVVMGPTTTDGFLWLGALAALPTSIAGAAIADSTASPLMGRDVVAAGADAFVQRIAGQIAYTVLFTASASVVGAIAAVRLGMAPLTTIYTSAAGLALTGRSVNFGGVRRLVLVFVAAGIGYVAVLLGLVSLYPALISKGLGIAESALRPLVVPIGIFVATGALAPVISTSLRRIGEPMPSLKARLGSSCALIGFVTLVVYVEDPLRAEVAAWAYAFAGVVGAVFWGLALGTLRTPESAPDAEIVR